MAPGPVNPWIIRPRRNPQAALRLVCFPFAGGGASIFRTWPSALPDDIEVLAIELPGRESRFKEKPFDRIGPLITALADAVIPELQGPFAIYGHSLGALVGFRFARELRRRASRAPVHLFVSGRRAPQLPEPRPMHQLPEPEFLERLRRLGGIPDAVFRETELMEAFSPILRADISVAETGVAETEPPLATPITAMGGTSDQHATLDELDAWRIQTSGSFEREAFDGGHFFLQTARPSVLGSLSRRLARITAML